jgi:hypothetical protein
MTPEQIQKDMEMKELLNIPYDSNMYKIYNLPKDLIIPKVSLVLNEGVISLKTQMSDKSREFQPSDFLRDIANFFIKDFCLFKYSHWDNIDETEKIKVILTVGDVKGRLWGNNKISDLYSYIFSEIYKKGNLPLSLEFTNESPIEDKIKLYKLLSGEPEEIFKKILHPTVNNSKLDNRKPTSSWRSPFSSSSLKHLILMDDKLKAIFTIEYLWGKKLNTNVNGAEMMRTLATLPNSNFGINDVQVLYKFTCSYYQKDLKSLKQHLEDCGIKPASDLSRWKRRLEQTVDKVN